MHLYLLADMFVTVNVLCTMRDNDFDVILSCEYKIPLQWNMIFIFRLLVESFLNIFFKNAYIQQ